MVGGKPILVNIATKSFARFCNFLVDRYIESLTCIYYPCCFSGSIQQNFWGMLLSNTSKLLHPTTFHSLNTYLQTYICGNLNYKLCRYVECTSSSIQALALFRMLYPKYRKKDINAFITSAVRYLEDMQTADGSWYFFSPVCRYI